MSKKKFALTTKAQLFGLCYETSTDLTIFQQAFSFRLTVLLCLWGFRLHVHEIYPYDVRDYGGKWIPYDTELSF